MKKIIIVVIATIIAVSASAQTWTVGGRIGAGFQATAEYHGLGEIGKMPLYVEGRFGMAWNVPGGKVCADFTPLVMLEITEFGKRFFFDSGIGMTVGGRGHYCFIGPSLSAKVGCYVSNSVKLAIDWTPMLGAQIVTGGGSSFHKYGLCNFGLSCAYCF